MRSSYKEYMQAAIDLARSSPMESMHGCVIVNEKTRGDPIIARGINTHVHYQEDRGVFSRHAEMSALANLIAIKGHNSRFFQDCIAFVARVGTARQGHPVRMSRPCIKCQKLLKKVGIQKVYYTYDNDTVCVLKSYDDPDTDEE